MKTLMALAAFTLATSALADEALDRDLAALRAEITLRGQAYADLSELTAMGHRLTGSPNAARAIDWATVKLDQYGSDSVKLQPMTTPVWTRGDVTEAWMPIREGVQMLEVAALGGSIGTGPEGVDAEIIEVHSLAEVAQLGEAVRGKIVFYNRPMDPSIDPFEAYGGAVDQRSAGASQAARYGAVATLVRTMTTLTDDHHPHTGNMRYRDDAPKIPAAAISTHGANILAANPGTVVHLRLSSEMHEPATSYNVIGEIRGSELPDEIVLVGGHLDSWDLGVGAHDDGAGVVQSIETLRAIKALGLRPKRTIRVVLFMAEEFGGYGGRDYAAEVQRAGERHIAAIESDRGGFAPVGFETDAGPVALARLQQLAPLLAPLGATRMVEGGSGTDIDPLRELGAATIGFLPEAAHYFDYHHAATDQLSAVNQQELENGAAAIASLAYAIAMDGM